MSITVDTVLLAAWRIAPRDLAEEWDNVGLLAGHPHTVVTGILCALDLTSGVIDEAVKLGCNLIVTHHPILFRGRKNLREDDPEGAMLVKLVRSRIALIALHTNYDNAQPGVNDALAAALGLMDIKAERYIRVGTLHEPVSIEVFSKHIETALSTKVRVYGNPGSVIRTAAVMGGSGGDYYRDALALGVDAFVTGEMGYHVALDAVDNGLNVCIAGHDGTERTAVAGLCSALMRELDGSVSIFESKAYAVHMVK